MSMDDMNPDVQESNDDRLWALLAYVFTPVIPIVLMLLEDKKNRPYIRQHNAQALVLGVVNFVISAFLGWLVFPLCLSFVLWVLCIYWGVQAYNGQPVVIPVITDFVKNQGWA